MQIGGVFEPNSSITVGRCIVTLLVALTVQAPLNAQVPAAAKFDSTAMAKEVAGEAAVARERMPSRVQEKPETGSTRLLSTSRGVASRRGPSTGLKYVPTTDSDFRRTERLRFEVAVDDVRGASARLLGPAGTPVNLPVSVFIRLDELTKQSVVVAELALAALAQAEYELELTLDERGEKNIVTYRFAVVP